MRVCIRNMREDDLGSVMQIWLEANTGAHDFIPKDYWLDQFDTTKKLIPLAEVYVCECDGKIVGFIGLSDHYIEGLFVELGSQSNGFGKRLLDYVKKKRTSGLCLDVYKKNVRAMNFYQREGFRVQSVYIDPNTGEEDISMAWNPSYDT